MAGDVKSYILFTTPYCGACKPVKDYLSTVSLKGQHLDASSSEGSDVAVQYGVRSVPTIVLLDAGGREVGRATSASSLRGILDEAMMR